MQDGGGGATDEEDEDQNASAREKQQENELKQINQIYLNESDEPESQNVAHEHPKVDF